MDYRLLLDLIVSILLAATIAYAWMLNRRLDQLRGNRDDMAKVIAAFNDATQRAEVSIPRLKRAADEAGQAVQERVEKAQLLRDDLAFMIERADALADRLEEQVRVARTEQRVEQRPAQMAPASGGLRPRPTRSASEAAPAPLAAPLGSGSGGAGSGSSGSGASGPVFAANEFEVEDERSEAERELLRALQSAR